jgi:PAS domain S-box-containing protein
MSNLSILIVEDEAIVAEDLAGKVRQLGYDVAGITATGEEAIELARRHKPTLVLMDIRLAGEMDGITAAQEIHRGCNLPVLFLTANSDMSTVNRALQAEAFGYILKPFDERDLQIQIQMALYKHAAERRLRESEERLALAVSAAQIGMFDRSLPSGSTLWTQISKAIFGYSQAITTPTTTATSSTEHEQSEWTDRVHPEDMPFIEEEFRRCLQDHEPLEVQYRIIWTDGSLHWVETKAVFLYDEDDKASRLLGVVMDITKRKKI